MKKIFGLTAACIIVSFSLCAQQKREVKTLENNMTKDLNLSEAQQAQLKKNREEGKTKMDALNKEENITVKEMRERKAALQQEQKSKMEALLTPEQKKAIEVKKSENKGKKGGKEEKRAAMVKEKLGLSDEQAEKLKIQNDGFRAKIKAIQENTTLNEDQKKEQMKTVKDEATAERKSQLTPEQITKMEEMRKEKMAAKKKKGGKKGDGEEMN